MPLTLIRNSDVGALFDDCSERFLAGVGECPGPTGFGAHLWVAQESQLDLLYERARDRGIPGWLGPPVTLMRRLAERFELRDRRIGLLTRRRLIARVAGRVAGRVGLRDPSRSDGVVRGHMLDALFGELLPEGVTPDHLQKALDELGRRDSFAHKRDAWVVGAYREYLSELQRLGRIDARQTHALVAERIDEGKLPGALGGATTLDVYGLYMLRSRHRLLASLARQQEVAVRVWILRPGPGDPEVDEWERFARVHECVIEEVGEGAPKAPQVQPTPDTQREIEWVARRVKRLLVEERVEPHRIAVVARSGEEDTGRVHRALRDAGIDATTIVRARLTEIAALRALLQLFRGVATGWPYRTLRPVLDNTLLDIRLDLRTLDFVAGARRVEGLENWERAIENLLAGLRDTWDDSDRPRDRDLRRSGLWADSVERDLEAFRAVRERLELLDGARSEREWIELTLALLRDEHPAAFHLRRRLCEPAGADGDDERWDTVRLDQRGVRQTEILLREWLDLEHGQEPLAPDAWRQLLGRMLEANELSLTTPVHKGVQVLEAHDAALQPFEHLFVVHANDGVFPRGTPTGGVLSNDERARLRDAGVPLSGRDLDLQRERALWRAVTSSGVVTLSYRTADAGGTPLLPSLLVPPHDESLELPRLRTRYEADDDRFAPVTAAQANQRAAVALHDRLAGGSSAPSAGGDAAALRQAVVAAVAEAHRDPAAASLDEGAPALRPNPWNGWVRDPRVLEALAARFPDDYRWSASLLESYSRLPFHFLLDRVLGYGEMKEADEEVTPLVFGSMAHEMLERFYEAVKEELPTCFESRAEAAFEAAAEATLAQVREDDRWLGNEELWTPAWQSIRDAVRDYLVWELPYLADKRERPLHLEYRFGYGEEDVRIQARDVAGRSGSLRLCGRIDRVDQGPKGLHVLDYKKASAPAGTQYQDGTVLQAALYLKVLEEAGHPVAQGYYRTLKSKAAAPTAKYRTPDGRDYAQRPGLVERHKPDFEAALTFARTIPGRIRSGLFEPVLSWKSQGWARWYPDRDIARSRAQLTGCNRYQDVTPLAPSAAPPLPHEAPAPGGTSTEEASPARLPFEAEEGRDE